MNQRPVQTREKFSKMLFITSVRWEHYGIALISENFSEFVQKISRKTNQLPHLQQFGQISAYATDDLIAPLALKNKKNHTLNKQIFFRFYFQIKLQRYRQIFVIK